MALTFKDSTQLDSALILEDIAIDLLKEGPDHLQLLRAKAFYQSGETFRRKGDYFYSLDRHLTALDIRSKYLSKDHSDIATSNHSVGAIYLMIGDHRKALKYLEPALASKIILYGENHIEVDKTCFNVAVAYYCLKNYSQAKKYFIKSEDIRRTIHGPNHPSLADSYSATGTMLIHSGEIEDGLEEYK